MNAEDPVNRMETRLITIETNQEAYLQIWKRAGDALPELVLPAKETGRISLKIAAGQGQKITLPSDSDRLTIRISRFPFGPMTRQEVVLAGRGSPGQLEESGSGMESPATYVANPDPSIGEIAVDIRLGTQASP